jgi:hypothetical protein
LKKQADTPRRSRSCASLKQEESAKQYQNGLLLSGSGRIEQSGNLTCVIRKASIAFLEGVEKGSQRLRDEPCLVDGGALVLGRAKLLTRRPPAKINPENGGRDIVPVLALKGSGLGSEVTGSIARDAVSKAEPTTRSAHVR